MKRVRTTVRLPVPEPRPKFDGYELDALSIEFDAQGEGIGWRLELGLGLDIFWALPTEWYDRLRLVHVDSAVRFVDEPSLILDPYLITLPTLHFSGDNLGRVHAEGGDRILVAAEVGIDAGVFAVQGRMLCPDGQIRLYLCRTVLDDD